MAQAGGRVERGGNKVLEDVSPRGRTAAVEPVDVAHAVLYLDEGVDLRRLLEPPTGQPTDLPSRSG